ncbi:MAG: general secretion pathway protein GspN [Pseudomonas sp.]|nr:general secretion pathway protein GspN [Pseudomonas sp.]
MSPRTLSLIAVAVGLAAVCALIATLDARPDWLPTPAAKPQAASQGPALKAPNASLESLALTWQQPLFSPQRAADVAAAGGKASDLAGFTLTGVMLNGDLHVALLRDSSGHTVRVHQGQALANGWTLQQLDPLEAQFGLQGQTRSLRLPAPRLPPPSRAAMLTLPPVPAQ